MKHTERCKETTNEHINVSSNSTKAQIVLVQADSEHNDDKQQL